MTPRHKTHKIVCECLKVSEDAILEAVRTREISTVKDIIRYTQAGDGCTACHPALKEYLRKKAQCPASSPPDSCSDR